VKSQSANGEKAVLKSGPKGIIQRLSADESNRRQLAEAPKPAEILS
jgi:hypothetical protein